MEIQINRELKIILLKALKDGYLETNEITKFETGDITYDLSVLTDEERVWFIEMCEKVTDDMFQKDKQ
jgi:hypothetical protein